MTAKQCLARRLRRFADRIDGEHAPRPVPLSFTIEPRLGITVHDVHPRPGCPLYYISDDDWNRAHTETRDRRSQIDPDTGQWIGVARP